MVARGRELANRLADSTAVEELISLIVNAEDTAVTRELAELLLVDYANTGLTAVVLAYGRASDVADDGAATWIFTAVEDIFLQDFGSARRLRSELARMQIADDPALHDSARLLGERIERSIQA